MDGPEKIHFLGIGGVGMAALAVLLKNRGWDVSGCDLAAGERTRWLQSLGIRFFRGHDPAHLAGSCEVVATPAVPLDNPERKAAAGRVRMRGDVLADVVNAAPDSVAVCGSHGKTTTATFTARLLIALGEDVEWAIGGETNDFPVAGRSRRDKSAPADVLVVEADESDGTLANYRAKTLVVTNCEYDHPDHFATRADYFACFDAARRSAAAVVESESLAPLAFLDALPAYAALAPHNRRNARAAVEVALRRGHSRDAIAAALPGVVSALPDRRFERVAPGVFTDYAHHPTEIACAVSMARQICRGRLLVVFQPHRYSRTKAFLKDFPAALALADEVVLCPVYPAFEPPVEGGDIADLYAVSRAAFSAAGPRLLLARSCDEAWEHVRNSSGENDVILLLGAGNIIDLLLRVKSECAQKAKREIRKVLTGQGSNMWKSDLNLDVAYVKTSGPAGEPGASLVAARAHLCPWMAGIPGSIGGWVKMNAGAFGHSISEVVESVKVDGEWISREACGFGYRTSAIAGEIQDVRWIGDGSCTESPADFLSRRRKFPSGTKGSVFKNPANDFAGRLLEQSGAKDLKVGGAFVWREHANVIVAGPGATAGDFLALARLMHRRVYFRTGVWLEPEVVGIDVS